MYEAIRRWIELQAGPNQNMRLFLKNKLKGKRARGVAQEAEHL
jgi:hypothetical protein